MLKAKTWGRPFILLLWSLLLTALTGVMGLAPLRAFRYIVGALPFFFITLVTASIFWTLKIPSMAVGFFILSIMTFMMVEAEEGGFTHVGSAAVAVLGGALITAFGFLMWVRTLGPDWLKLAKNKFEIQANAILELSQASATKISAADLFAQTPSIVICSLIIAAALGLVFEKPIFSWAKIAKSKGKSLTSLKLPDFLIWTTIVGLLLAYVDMGQPLAQGLGSNILNVCAVTYFFQGLAILCKYFEVFRVTGFWKALWLVLFVTQLFFVLSLVGFIDFWIDFRGYFVQKAGDILKRSKQ